MRHDFVITVQHSDAPKAYRDQFNALMTDVFGFDFSDWHKHGGWNQDYACYSIIEGGEILTIYDVVPRERVIFEALCRHLNFPGANLIQFGFNPDWILQDYEWVDYAEDPIFVRGDTGLGGDFILPLLVRT